MGLLDQVMGRAQDGVRTLRSALDGLVTQANSRLDDAETRLGLDSSAGRPEDSDDSSPRGQADVEVIDIQRHPRTPPA